MFEMTSSSIETLTKENITTQNFCHVIRQTMIPSIGVFTHETLCKVNHAEDSLSNKLMLSELSSVSGNMNQNFLVGGIPSNSCDKYINNETRVRATQNRNCSWNIENVFGAERCERT